MHWPAATSSTDAIQGHMHSLFISPSTQSVSVQVDSLQPTVLNRPSSGSVTTSDITLAAPVGTDVFSIKLYDQDNAAGNLLGETAVSKTITADAANTVSATVNGVLGKIALGPVSSPFVQGDAISGFVLVGGAARDFIATPEDADGNAIVAPGAIPTITLTSGSSVLKVATTSTVNEFTLQAVGASTTPITLQASSPGTPVTASFSIAESAALYVSNFKNNTITVYDQRGNQISTSGTFPNLDEPSGSAFDPVNGELYVANNANSTITVYNQNGGQISEAAGTFPSLDEPLGIAFDPVNDDLYVTNSGNGTITVYNQSGGQISEASGAFPSLDGPFGIVFDPVEGLLYVTDEANSSITVYSPSGILVGTSGTFPNLDDPAGIAFDPVNGELYVANWANSSVTVYDENGNQITPSGTFPNLLVPYGIAFDPVNDELYAASSDNNMINVYDQNGNILGLGLFPNVNSPLLLTTVP
jgi:DNA-binding beta-propeller fold protein YncE